MKEKNQKYVCDLHVHSSESDGFYTKEEVIVKAIEENRGKEKIVLAISDHNRMFEDIEELQKKYKNQITLVSGCEVSTSYVVPETGKNLEVHILALDYDMNNSEFRQMLLLNQYDKRHYIEMILKKLEEVGIHVVDDYQEIVDFAAPSHHCGRMALSRLMVKKGLCASIEECLDKYFGNYGKRLCYVDFPHTYVSMQTAINTIKQAKGIPILCHPFSYNLQNEQLLTLIRKFKELGGLAMECFYGSYTEEQRRVLKKLALKMALLPSAGSDFHGNPGQSLHNEFPGWIYDDLMVLKKQINKK